MKTLILIGLIGVAGISACQRVDKPADIVAVEATLPEKVDYNLHIKPILSDRCFACHGPDKAKQKAGLRLDTPEGAYDALTESGKHPIVPGNLASSEVFHRITSTDPDILMPTPESNLALSTEEKALIVRWIEQGAEYKPHWSLLTPVANAVPDVKETNWPKNDIDRFVLKKLEDKGLKHAPEADKSTLLRRVSLDLTGLPPTPAEVDAFLADQSPNAYEKVVNRLLSSPHYGERQAADWLDVARYADTHGYQDDGMRTMWPYRDWVIRAFNRNIPYSTFVTWQLAGDLLPKPTPDMLTATGFNRNHQQSQEGGIVPLEYETEYVSDRTNTFGKAMLGLTVECARCHDHKYDPISQKDYYALSAFFANNNEYGQIPYNGEPSPHITLPTAEAEAQLKFIREKITTTDKALTADNNGPAKQRFRSWLDAAATQPTPVLVPDQQDLVVYVPFDQHKDVPTEKPLAKTARKEGKPTVEKKPVQLRRLYQNMVSDTLPLETHGDLDHPIPFVKSPAGLGVQLVGESYLEMKNVAGKDGKFSLNAPGWFERNQPFTVSLWVNVNDPKLTGPLFNRNLGPFNGFRGYECERLEDGRLAFRISYVWPDDAIDLETVDKLPLNKWMQLTMAYDGSSRATGLHIYANGQPVRTRIITDNLTQSLIWGKKKSTWGSGAVNFAMGQLHDHNYKGYAVDELRIYKRKLTPLEVQSLFTGQNQVLTTLKTATRTAGQQGALFDYFLTNVDRLAQEQRLTREQLLGQETSVLNEQIDVMVMRERKYARPSFILKRGAYDVPGDRVEPATPGQLMQMPDDLPKNRLGLAKWLLQPDNPLFSRVVANRFWQQFFGKGIVTSVDDFGNQGALPTHLELLDWLAVQFRSSGGPSHGWNVKALQKRIVMSATYRQASSVPEKAREADPDNALLSRGPSYRMSAEQVRDIALTASGLLTQRIGGPSVLPYQPAGIWEALATRNAVTYRQSKGDSMYRRSLYTIWKRSSPPPMMLDFDASERAFCIVKRQKTSTPLQALVTLNDPQFVEAARVLAQRLLANGDHDDKLVNDAFKAIISRPARPQELILMKQLYADELSDFRKNPKRAQDLLTVGDYPVDKKQNPIELAAWTVVASTVMNFDEAIIKR